MKQILIKMVKPIEILGPQWKNRWVTDLLKEIIMSLQDTSMEKMAFLIYDEIFKIFNIQPNVDNRISDLIDDQERRK